ncbi:MAG: type II and III secretion system protein, partial [Planctomycetota bacterium]
TDTASRVLQAPKLITLDNQAATIFVGDSIRYAETNVILNDNGTTQVSLVESGNSPVNFGFRLFIHPHIIPGTDKIFLTVVPENDTLTGSGGTGILAGFNRFTSGQNTLDLPQVRSQSMITNVKIESGETIIIGGLYSENMSRTLRKIPFLGDIPLIGYFFKTSINQKSIDDLLIFISPRIVSSSGAISKELTDRLTQDRSDLEKEFYSISGEEPIKTDAPTKESQGNGGKVDNEEEYLEDYRVEPSKSTPTKKSGIFY